MEAKLQNQIAFCLTGRRDGSALRPIDSTHRPALFARYRDLSSLRYDFPLVLNRDGLPEQAVLSLTRLVDDAVEGLGEELDHGRIARHGYRLEGELRRELSANGPGDFATIWKAATVRLTGEGYESVQDSSKRLWAAFRSSGEIVDVGPDLPSRVVRHAWNSVQAVKAEAFRERAEHLLLKLRNILAAETVGSTVGRSPERLRAGVGSSFAGSFDFDAMSSILIKAKPGIQLSDERRNRISDLIKVLEQQRFFQLADDGPEPYTFAFDRCTDALSAFQERHEEAVELVKTLAVAELEVNGDYRESVHSVLFASFGANGLDGGELAELPDYLIYTNAHTLDAIESAELVQLLAAGLPFKILVQTDDVLEPSAVAEGHVALGLRSRQLVDTAIWLTDVFVFQSSASHLFRMRDSLMRGLSYNGPALFSVFSGSNSHTSDLPAYLVSAAAMESRVFPALVYDPSAGSDWASRLKVGDNPQPDDDWPVHSFAYEDRVLQVRSEKLVFTMADFMAMDERFFRHYAVVPEPDWNDAMVTVQEALEWESSGLQDKVPYVSLVDNKGLMLRAIVDNRTMLEVRRCQTMWHSLQELGGIHNSHAERLLAQERNVRAAAAVSPSQVAETPVAATVPTEFATATEVSVSESAADDSHNDDPYIETARCTSCNECTNLNNRMFSYNEDKQAYIADLDAGTFRQLVEAAEGCQVSIIHPGKPRNPKEPGLEDLIRRAAEFN